MLIEIYRECRRLTARNISVAQLHTLDLIYFCSLPCGRLHAGSGAAEALRPFGGPLNAACGSCRGQDCVDGEGLWSLFFKFKPVSATRRELQMANISGLPSLPSAQAESSCCLALATSRYHAYMRSFKKLVDLISIIKGPPNFYLIPQQNLHLWSGQSHQPFCPLVHGSQDWALEEGSCAMRPELEKMPEFLTYGFQSRHQYGAVWRCGARRCSWKIGWFAAAVSVTHASSTIVLVLCLKRGHDSLSAKAVS